MKKESNFIYDYYMNSVRVVANGHYTHKGQEFVEAQYLIKYLPKILCSRNTDLYKQYHLANSEVEQELIIRPYVYEAWKRIPCTFSDVALNTEMGVVRWFNILWDKAKELRVAFATVQVNPTALSAPVYDSVKSWIKASCIFIYYLSARECQRDIAINMYMFMDILHKCGIPRVRQAHIDQFKETTRMYNWITVVSEGKLMSRYIINPELIAILKANGALIDNIVDLDDVVNKVLNLGDYELCRECGVRFKVKAQAKIHNICPECYKKYRTGLVVNYNKIKREAKLNGD